MIFITRAIQQECVKYASFRISSGHGGLVVRCRFQARSPIPLKIRRVLGLLHIKSTSNRPISRVSNVLPLVWCGSVERDCQFRGRPHLPAVQNDEVRPKIAPLVLC
ncbi:hypothetical protein AVEN_251110-1 [Araneus ventricosus]|uniref:Uncharacterized protein n=1 Tax=Araneus ventricosus TaxID=182803 RepID=A0A4Y2P9N1_ARAVE|nr:hypothetical protein AVEN_251110-1 [Araneus ventricosus]